MSSELYKSYPAASEVLRVSAFPFGVSISIWRSWVSFETLEIERFILTTCW